MCNANILDTYIGLKFSILVGSISVCCLCSGILPTYKQMCRTNWKFPIWMTARFDLDRQVDSASYMCILAYKHFSSIFCVCCSRLGVCLSSSVATSWVPYFFFSALSCLTRCAAVRCCAGSRWGRRSKHCNAREGRTAHTRRPHHSRTSSNTNKRRGENFICIRSGGIGCHSTGAC